MIVEYEAPVLLDRSFLRLQIQLYLIFVTVQNQAKFQKQV